MTEKHEDDNQEDYIDEGEYQFSDEEELSEEGYDDVDESESSKFSVQKVIALIKQRPVIAVFGVLVLVLIVYVLLGGNKGSKSTQNITTAAFVQAPKKLMTQKTVQPAIKKPTISTAEQLLAKQVKQAAAKKQAAQTAVDKSIFAPTPIFSHGSEAQASLDTLKGQMTRERNEALKTFAVHYNNKMQLLDNSNQATARQLREVRAEMILLRDTIKALQVAIEKSQKIQKRILFNQGMSFDASGAQLMPMQDTRTAPKKTLTIKRSPTYQIQAIVPGRAWLRSSTGETMTVSQGDKVPEMGVVMEIDAIAGIVTLSSGRIIGSN